MKRNAEEELNLPPGFRFFPTDEELLVHYLCNKANLQSLPVPIIAEVDLYKYDPWQLPEKALFGEKEWYFFTPRDRKYPNGSRPNRAAGSGYWKATGADKPIASKAGKKRVGIKKALVFYAGRAPRGTKTNWIMHEYRLADSNPSNRTARKKGSLRLDDWVLCRIYNKKSSAEKIAIEEQNNASAAISADQSAIEQTSNAQHAFARMDPCPLQKAVPPINLQNPQHFQNPFAFNSRRNPSENFSSGLNANNNQWTKQIFSEFQTDSSCSDPVSEKEEVQSSFTVDHNHQQQQQSLLGFPADGLQNPFPSSLEGISTYAADSYQDFFNSLTTSDYLPKFYVNDMLF